MYGTVVQKNKINELINAINTIDRVIPTRTNFDYRNTVQQYMNLYEEK